MDPVLLHFPDQAAPAARLAEALALPKAEIHVHRFPDGEVLVRLPETGSETVVVMHALSPANDRLVELGLACETLRAQGRRVLLVLPYLCYMRQDTAFRPGEVVSQHIVGRWLAHWGDALVTVDPHLHRTHRLEDAVPVARARVVSAAPLLGRYAAARWPGCLLLGPDEESAQWVRQAAEPVGLEWAVAHKVREGDRSVRIRLPEHPRLRGRTLVLIDDMAVTGRTLAEAARLARRGGAAQVHALVTHALFTPDALPALQAAGITEIASSDTLPHPSNRIQLSGALAAALRPLLESRAVPGDP
ncbi:MAG: ribose-phosphate diphosphokinase [Gammaproteobacteria bacterium]|nr:MAG: ribose-phosphate diphosphokinase [Gammaproteobacteria bacterium]